jgi:hypothetical protein
MKVAEKDNAVHGMLDEEYKRCCNVLASLRDKVSRYPKGALNLRKKHYKGKEYVYHYLVLREGDRVVNRHVSDEVLSNLRGQLEQRDKCRQEMLIYKKRIAYLEKLLHNPRNRGGRSEDPA